MAVRAKCCTSIARAWNRGWCTYGAEGGSSIRTEPELELFQGGAERGPEHHGGAQSGMVQRSSQLPENDVEGVELSVLVYDQEEPPGESVGCSNAPSMPFLCCLLAKGCQPKCPLGSGREPKR